MTKRVRLRIIAFLIVALAACLAPVYAYAKTVYLEWKPIKGAAKYELQIEKKGKVVYKKTVDDTSWKGDLAFGVYLYQLRAYDKVNRPGQWSKPLPLVVMPRPPEATAPADGANVGVYSAKASVVLRWNAVNGATGYEVTVKHAGKTVYRESLQATSADLPALTPGNYRWTVKALFQVDQIDGRVPAELGAKKWESKPSDVQDFTVEQKQLDAPKPLHPLGRLAPPAKGQMAFAWKPVEGAEAYEVQVIFIGKRAEDKTRVIAAVAEKTKSFTTDKTTLPLKLPGEGHYTWSVRALANIDSNRQPGAVGPKSEMDFELNKTATFTEGFGYIALSTMLAPYTYRVVSPETGFEGSTASNAVTIRLSGEYWYNPNWGAGFGLENTAIQILGRSFDRKTFEATWRYRLSFSNDRYGWFLYPKLGVEFREYPELRPISTDSQTGQVGSFDILQVATLGPLLGLDIRKQFSERFSLGAKFGFYYPMTIMSGPSSGSLTGDASYRNISFGIQGLYWMSRNWGLGYGALFENRSVSYTNSTTTGGSSGSTSRAQQIYIDGSYFFGSIIYSFGR